ncbi:MAG: class I SAM-dependent methyltransferase [Planctomycetota bacterium]
MTTLRTCPLCQTRDRSVLFAEASIDRTLLDEFAFASRKMPEYMHHRLNVCRDCDLVYADTLPDEVDLSAAYQSAAFDSGVEAAFAARTYAKLLSSQFSRLPDRVGAVDIGTGDGAFLRELLMAGFSEVSGVEPSSAPIAAAPPDIRARIRSGLFHRGLFPAASCSLVTCFQTIEHVANPLELCVAAKEILKDGGLFCLVGHNRRSISAAVLGRRSPIYDIEHLQLFSPTSMRQLLKRAGFQQIHVGSFWNRYPLSYWMKLFPFPKTFKLSLLKSLSVTGVGRIPIKLPAGNLVAWGVK